VCEMSECSDLATLSVEYKRTEGWENYIMTSLVIRTRRIICGE